MKALKIVYILCFGIATACITAGCAPAKNIKATTNFRAVIDTVTTVYKTVPIVVPGATVYQTLNVDSIVNILKQLNNGQPLPTQIIERIKQPIIMQAGKNNEAELKYWVNEFGQLQLSCSAKERQLQAVVAENTRYRKDSSFNTITVDKLVYKTSWRYVFIAAGVFFLLGAIALILFLKYFNK